MITLHHLENSRSQRVLWLLEELDLPYEVKRYKRHPRTLLAPPELQRVHPLGKSPVITEGDATVAESGAIVEYLLDAHGQGRLRPAAGTPARLQYTYWLHAAEGTMMPPLLLKLVFGKISGPDAPLLVRPLLKAVSGKVNRLLIEPNVMRHAAFIEATLAASGWFAGNEFSAADIQMSYVMEVMEQRVGIGSRGAMHDWLQRVRARPAYQRALQKGGPFSADPSASSV